MWVQLLGSLLFACQIILNESSVIPEKTGSVGSVTLPEGYVAFPDVHTAYKIHTENTTWNYARELCVAEGAHLAIADSAEKIAHMSSLKIDSEYEWMHTGIYFSNATDEWVRVDNDVPIASMPWAEDNPDGSGTCTGILANDEGISDYDCEAETTAFVCEIEV